MQTQHQTIKNNGNLFAALRAAFPQDLNAVAVETDNGLFYSWRDLDRACAMIANLLAALDLPAGFQVRAQLGPYPEIPSYLP